MRKWKRSETKAAEEYCWAIIQASRRSCWGRKDASVLESGFNLDSHVCTCVVEQCVLSSKSRKIWLASNLPALRHCPAPLQYLHNTNCTFYRRLNAGFANGYPWFYGCYWTIDKMCTGPTCNSGMLCIILRWHRHFCLRPLWLHHIYCTFLLNGVMFLVRIS